MIPKLTNQSSFDDPRIYLESLPRLEAISVDSSSVATKKRGDGIGYDGFRHIAGRHKEAACCSWFCRVFGGSDCSRTGKQTRVHAARRYHGGGCHEENCRQRRRHIEDMSSTHKRRLQQEIIRSYLRARMMEDCTIPRRRTKKKRNGKSHNGKEGRRVPSAMWPRGSSPHG